VTEFFGSVRGALSVYCDNNDGALTDARFILARFGEDPDKVVATFWREHNSGNFTVIPLFAYTTRLEKSSAQSNPSARR
jgi:hypothetical protein